MTRLRARIVTTTCSTMVWILTLGVPAAAAAQGLAGTPSSRSAEADALRSDISRLELENAMAESGDFYLVLDPTAGTLELFLEGVPLRTYSASGAEVGRPFRWFLSRSPAIPVTDRIWVNARLYPQRVIDRVEIVSDRVVPPDRTGAVDWVPPTPEEQFPALGRYFVRYDAGLLLEVVAATPAGDAIAGGAEPGQRHGKPGPWTRLRRRIADRLSVVFRGGNDVRVRISLPAEEAARLYRSLPAQSRLLILPLATEPAAAQHDVSSP